MTDTTDIKALRERMMQQREAALTGSAPSFEECELLVCDLLRALTLSNNQIEAERQRAAEINRHYHRVVSERDDAVDELEELRNEISQLKGEQVPHGYIDPKVENGGMWVKTRAREGDQFTAPIFTAPQKPVVLPGKITRGFVELAEMYGCEPAQAQFIAVGWNAAIEAAGGIVKDGE